MKDIVVLAGDESLLTVICSELNFLGFSTGTVGERECRLLIVDADSRTALAGAESVKHERLIYVSREGTPDGAGAYVDAVLRRPISVRELRCAVGNLLSGSEKNVPPVELHTDILPDEMTLDGEDRTVRIGKERVGLSEKEFSVLSLLLSKKGESVSREEISAAIGAGNSNEADVYIGFLRKKLERDGKRRIITARGVGYKLI